MSSLTQERLKELLEYNPETGVWTWRQRSSLCVHVGQTAGALSNGYVVIRVDGVLYRSHRLAWVWMTGDWPSGGEIDHINGVRSDNRWCNLRIATRSQNNLNSKKRRTGKNPFRGVYWREANQKWMACVTYEKKSVYLGYFSTAEAAHEAYLTAAKGLYGEFVRIAS